MLIRAFECIYLAVSEKVKYILYCKYKHEVVSDNITTKRNLLFLKLLQNVCLITKQRQQ